MRFALLATITATSACLLIGCGNAGKAAPTTDELTYRIVYDGPTRPPDLDGKSALFMRAGEKNVTVGIGAELLREMFPKPEKATEIRQLPPGFTEDYLSRGWETEDESVGWVSYSGQAVLVMQTLRRLEDGDLQRDYVQQYTRLFSGIEPTVIQGATASFWFWQNGPHRFMICGTKSRKGGIDITLALGDVSIMDALRMMPSKAEFDKGRADTAWAEDAAKAAKNKQASK
ncbi:MAG: hypothetical protein KF784_07115 [Fimbriimonadaceae bacterium]|nr:hypothetical protein [Fimbriimonadaceae bacterium]